jgi:hypothetical protein
MVTQKIRFEAPSHVGRWRPDWVAEATGFKTWELKALIEFDHEYWARKGDFGFVLPTTKFDCMIMINQS